MSNQKIPNVFIKEINLFDSTNDELSVSITAEITDTKDENSWSRNIVNDYMRILVVISGNPSLNQNITDSRIQFDKDVLNSQYFDDTTVKIFSVPIKTLRKIDSPNGLVFLSSFKAQFEKNINEVRVFCSAYLEMSELFQKANLDISSPPRRYGSVSSDYVIQFGNIVNTTTVFTLPSGDQYFGPVHLHPDKGYMVGPKHMNVPHSTLSTVSVANFKLKDFRKKNFSSPISTPMNKKTEDISNLNYSINNVGNAAGSFSINFKNLLFYQTKYGDFLKTLSENAISQNLNNIKIKNFQIIRKRIDVDETYIVGTTFSDFEGSEIVPFDAPLISHISEIVTNQSDIRTFQFVDKTITKTTIGDYQYHLKLSFVDPTVQFVSDLIEDLKTSVAQMKEYYFKLNKRKNYDFPMDKTKMNFYVNEYKQLRFSNYDNPSWASANEVYTRTASYLFNLTEIQKRDLSVSISTKVDPKNATVFSLNSFNEDLFILNNKFQKSFDLSNNNNQADSARVSLKNAEHRNIIFLDYIFNETYKPQNYNISYDYMNFAPTLGVPILTKAIIENRAANEYKKFFISAPSDSQSQLIPKEYENLLDLNENLYSFFSPMSVILGEQKINLNDINLIDIKRVNQIFNRSNKINVFSVSQSDKKHTKSTTEEMSSPKSNPKTTKTKTSVIKLEEY